VGQVHLVPHLLGLGHLRVPCELYLAAGQALGSSGALCGLIGAWVVFAMLTWRQTLPRDELDRNITFSSLLVAVVICAALSVLPLVDWAAHLGGFVMGSLLALCCFGQYLEQPLAKYLTIGFGALLAIMAVAGCFVYLVTSVRPTVALLHLCQPGQC